MKYVRYNNFAETSTFARPGVVLDGNLTGDIRAAYARLIQMAHPDKGGTAGLAAQLNAAAQARRRRRPDTKTEQVRN